MSPSIEVTLLPLVTIQIYNLGTGRGYSVFEMIKAFEKASNKSISMKLCPRRSGDLESMYADATLATNELGWRAKRSLDEMCKLNLHVLIFLNIFVYITGQDLWRWQSNNPNGYN